MPCHPHQITKPSVALSSTASVLLRKVPRGGAVVGRGAGCGIAADNLLTTRGARSHRHSSTLQRGSCGPKRSTAASPATSTHDAPWRLLRAPARRSSGLDDRWSAAGPPTLVGSGFRSEGSIGHKCRWGGGARGGGPLVPLLQDPPRLRRLPGRSQARQPEVGVPDAGTGGPRRQRGLQHPRRRRAGGDTNRLWRQCQPRATPGSASEAGTRRRGA